MAEHVTLHTKYNGEIDVAQYENTGSKRFGNHQVKAKFDSLRITEESNNRRIWFYLGDQIVDAYYASAPLARRFEVEWARISDYLAE